MKQLGTFLFVFCLCWTSSPILARPIPHTVKPYNTTYPLTQPEKVGDEIHFRLAIISDLDKDAVNKEKPNTYESYLKKGLLKYNPVLNSVQVEWDTEPATRLTSKYSNKGRGMELSELIVYDGRILSFDDKSGIVFALENNRAIPWVIISDGNGHSDKGFKSEWATVKDELLYVGSTGKEMTSADGEFLSYSPQYIKVINRHGEVQHYLWADEYEALKNAINYTAPGYVWHESAVWSPHKKLWHFLPRRCSHEAFDDETAAVSGCGYLITADEDFQSIQGVEVKKNNDPKLGFSSFKFIPGTNDDVIVAIRTVEYKDTTSTYITAFTTNGTELLPDTLVENRKYEGLEFL